VTNRFNTIARGLLDKLHKAQTRGEKAARKVKRNGKRRKARAVESYAPTLLPNHWGE